MNEIDAVKGLASTATLREFADQALGPPPRTESPVATDRVEISDLATFLSRLSELPEDRARKIVDIRTAIAEGTYETPEKLDAALNRLLEQLGSQP